jgi:8-oxo-dGTP pyrophosphatase MutT (NUDIX family)
MSSKIGKVIAYITNGRRLLVFRHTEFPQAGIQVPAGTIEPGESPETAVLREAYEETGLDDLVIVRYLGQQIQDLTQYGKKGHLNRHFIHLHCPGQPQARWRHVERFPSEGAHESVEFELFWAPGPHEIPPLVNELDHLLAEIPWDSLPS